MWTEYVLPEHNVQRLRPRFQQDAVPRIQEHDSENQTNSINLTVQLKGRDHKL